jgi:hypothetical protein
MCMRYIDNSTEGEDISQSRTWRGALLIDHGLRTRIAYATRSLLVPVAVHGNAQEVLTREKRYCESRRKLMFPHFFRNANDSFRTSRPESGLQRTSWNGLWITHVTSGASAWALLHETDTDPEGASNTGSARAGSTSAGAPVPSKVTAKPAITSREPDPRTVAHTVLGCESQGAGVDGKERGRL